MPGRAANRSAAAIRAAKKEIKQQQQQQQQQSAPASSPARAEGSPASPSLGSPSTAVSPVQAGAGGEAGGRDDAEPVGAPGDGIEGSWDELQWLLRAERERADVAERVLERMREERSQQLTTGSSASTAVLDELRDQLLEAEAAREEAEAARERAERAAATAKLDASASAASAEAARSEGERRLRAAEAEGAALRARELEAARQAHEAELAAMRNQHAAEVTELVSTLSRRPAAAHPGPSHGHAYGHAHGHGHSHTHAHTHGHANGGTAAAEGGGQVAGANSSPPPAPPSTQPPPATPPPPVQSPPAQSPPAQSPGHAVAEQVARAAEVVASAKVALASLEIANLGRHQIETVHALSEHLERLESAVGDCVSRRRECCEALAAGSWLGTSRSGASAGGEQGVPVGGVAIPPPGSANVGTATAEATNRGTARGTSKKKLKSSRSSARGGASSAGRRTHGAATGSSHGQRDGDAEPTQPPQPPLPSEQLLAALADEALAEWVSLEPYMERALHELSVAREQLYALLYSRTTLMGQHFLSNYPVHAAPPALLQPTAAATAPPAITTQDASVQCDEPAPGSPQPPPSGHPSGPPSGAITKWRRVASCAGVVAALSQGQHVPGEAPPPISASSPNPPHEPSPPADTTVSTAASAQLQAAAHSVASCAGVVAALSSQGHE